MSNEIETKHPVTEHQAGSNDHEIWFCDECLAELGLIHCRECHRDLPSEMFPQKLCPKCGLEKLHSEFYKVPKRPDGLSGWCKSCHREEVKAKKKAKLLGN